MAHTETVELELPVDETALDRLSTAGEDSD